MSAKVKSEVLCKSETKNTSTHNTSSGKTLAPGSDQIHRESGTSTVGGGRSPNPVHDWKHDSFFPCGNREASTCVTLNGSGIQLAVGPQPLWLRNHNFRLTHRIMVKRLATSPHDPLGITDSACKNQLIMVSVQYGPFNTYIPIRSTTIGKSRVARDPIAMHTSRRSNSDIACVTRGQRSNLSQQSSIGSSSRRPHPPTQSQLSGFQPPEVSLFRGPSQSQYSGPQQAQVNVMTREQADDMFGGVIAGTCLIFDYPARILFDTGSSHSF
ncbi:hypothetical protein F511_26081 [Dorcoceras hygrometricum]|uniref:Uncharacterized protein n=1 Tax=Dorcoceras hygrometricum TaxID=472368 RepID=A0A2Z7DG87_9LAMI|nr:hypothetical protein F511_26081 [Dorcoceras hygrometricum]